MVLLSPQQVAGFSYTYHVRGTMSRPAGGQLLRGHRPRLTGCQCQRAPPPLSSAPPPLPPLVCTSSHFWYTSLPAAAPAGGQQAAQPSPAQPRPAPSLCCGAAFVTSPAQTRPAQPRPDQTSPHGTTTSAASSCALAALQHRKTDAPRARCCASAAQRFAACAAAAHPATGRPPPHAGHTARPAGAQSPRVTHCYWTVAVT